MAHFLKWTREAANGAVAHYRRETETKKSYIDYDRTGLNRSVEHECILPEHVIEATGAYCMNRKDVNTMISLVITAPHELDNAPEAELMKFFGSVISHMRRDLKEKSGTMVGELGAYVHMDETRPHMHYCFVPLVRDARRGYKVSAKQWLTKSYLQSFHDRLERSVAHDMGYRVPLQHEDVRERMKARGVKNLDIDQYRLKKEQELMELESAISRRKEELRSYGIDPEQYKINERARHLQVERSILGR